MTKENENIIFKAMLKIYEVLNGYNNAALSISGGADSDIMLDLILRTVDKYNIDIKLYFVFVDTGLEYKATKEHIKYLENRYNIKIDIIKPVLSIPLSVKKYGVPFVSKRVSDYISRLQKYNFDFNTDSFEVNYKKYPHCKAALRWYTNNFGGRYDIKYNKMLREFLIDHAIPKVSKKCCDISKKEPLNRYHKENNIELSIQGLRRFEKGGRENIKSCWNTKENKFYPVLWFTDSTKEEYEHYYNITHSKCYMVYGLKRTGCVGCPFSMNYEKELNIVLKHEPQLYKACINVFKNAYEIKALYNNYKKGV